MEKISKYASNFCDLTGSKFGRLAVIGPADSKHGCSYWICKCECGEQRTIRARHLKTGRAKSCGCWSREMHRQLLLEDPIQEPLDLIGQKFGRLIVVAREKSKHNRSRWLCVCNCGVQVITSGKNLRDGKKKSCGCLRREMVTVASQLPLSTRAAYIQYKANAEKSNREFLFTRDQFAKIVDRNCSYCDQEKSGGIDRVDNALGYTPDNSVPCCQRCNLMKRTLPVEDFIGHCAKITEYQKNHKNL